MKSKSSSSYSRVSIEFGELLCSDLPMQIHVIYIYGIPTRTSSLDCKYVQHLYDYLGFCYNCWTFWYLIFISNPINLFSHLPITILPACYFSSTSIRKKKFFFQTVFFFSVKKNVFFHRIFFQFFFTIFFSDTHVHFHFSTWFFIVLTRNNELKYLLRCFYFLPM